MHWDDVYVSVYWTAKYNCHWLLWILPSPITLYSPYILNHSTPNCALSLQLSGSPISNAKCWNNRHLKMGRNHSEFWRTLGNMDQMEKARITLCLVVHFIMWIQIFYSTYMKWEEHTFCQLHLLGNFSLSLHITTHSVLETTYFHFQVKLH